MQRVAQLMAGWEQRGVGLTTKRMGASSDQSSKLCNALTSVLASRSLTVAQRLLVRHAGGLGDEGHGPGGVGLALDYGRGVGADP
jgi:hypothetical protein